MVAKPRFVEGTWFSVPLTSGHLAVGVVARTSNNNALLGYFFGPPTDTPLPSSRRSLLTPEDAAYVAIFSDLALRRGDWTILGPTPEWNRAIWATPQFWRKDSLIGRTYLVTYDEDVAGLRVKRDVLTPAEELVGLPEDGSAGSRYVELRLSRLLDGSAVLRQPKDPLIQSTVSEKAPGPAERVHPPLA